MAFALLRRVSVLASNQLPSHRCKLPSSNHWAFLGRYRAYSTTDRLHLSPLFPRIDGRGEECRIESMDEGAWRLSSGLAFDALKSDHSDSTSKGSRDFGCKEDEDDDNAGEIAVDSSMGEPDFDEIEDMRYRKNLFYKLDRDSKEYEEYKFDFHRRKKASKNEKEQKSSTKRGNTKKEIRPNKVMKSPLGPYEDQHLSPLLCKAEDSGKNMEDPYAARKQRTLTFNQLTGPYHEPFCLDIYVSKASVRASIIHRATSKVVAVAHSISKDMKFDLGSTKNKNACVAVGEVLARRALADDIYNVVYTPRKGEKLEGKLQIVLKAIVNSGVDVKVKLKQRNSRKASKIAGRR